MSTKKREGSECRRCQECRTHMHEGEADKHGVCFRCNFWLSFVGRPGGLVIDGMHFTLGNEDSTVARRGFDGQRFIIATNDGRTIITTNLWANGSVPEHFRSRLPDNARFVAAEH